jgi:hypothetical protein
MTPGTDHVVQDGKLHYCTRCGAAAPIIEKICHTFPCTQDEHVWDAFYQQSVPEEEQEDEDGIEDEIP